MIKNYKEILKDLGDLLKTSSELNLSVEITDAEVLHNVLNNSHYREGLDMWCNSNYEKLGYSFDTDAIYNGIGSVKFIYKDFPIKQGDKVFNRSVGTVNDFAIVESVIYVEKKWHRNGSELYQHEDGSIRSRRISIPEDYHIDIGFDILSWNTGVSIQQMPNYDFVIDKRIHKSVITDFKLHHDNLPNYTQESYDRIMDYILGTERKNKINLVN